jgi:hypothetical protein
MQVLTWSEAIDVYFKKYGPNADMPSRVASEYDDFADGWLLVNCHGVLALVFAGRTIIESVYDPEGEEWVLPER